jgi:hypothetical protein
LQPWSNLSPSPSTIPPSPRPRVVQLLQPRRSLLPLLRRRRSSACLKAKPSSPNQAPQRRSFGGKGSLQVSSVAQCLCREARVLLRRRSQVSRS